jgi:hypothetical protein
MSSTIDIVVPCDSDVFGGTAAHTLLFKTLASRSCRYVIYHFLVTAESNSCSVEQLVTGIQTLAGHQSKQPSVIDSTKLKTLLIEEAIPRLERLDVVDYDARSAVVRYYYQPFIEEYAEHAAYQELSSDLVRDSV